MASFWEVQSGKPVKHVGRPTRSGATSFSIGCSDDVYLAAGLYQHVDWDGKFDSRTQIMSTPRFVVDEEAQAVRVHYDISGKTEELVAAYDKEQADLLAESISAAAKKKLIELDLKSIRSLRECVAALPDAPQYLKDFEAEAVEVRKKIKV